MASCSASSASGFRLAVVALLSLPCCIDPEPPVLFVPLAYADPAADPVAVTVEALAALGFEVQRPDHARGTVTTNWRYGESLVGRTRCRVLVRIQSGPHPGVSVAVPQELENGPRWMMHGEDEEWRQKVVATLLSRMQASRGRRSE